MASSLSSESTRHHTNIRSASPFSQNALSSCIRQVLKVKLNMNAHYLCLTNEANRKHLRFLELCTETKRRRPAGPPATKSNPRNALALGRRDRRRRRRDDVILCQISRPLTLSLTLSLSRCRSYSYLHCAFPMPSRGLGSHHCTSFRMRLPLLSSRHRALSPSA